MINSKKRQRNLPLQINADKRKWEAWVADINPATLPSMSEMLQSGGQQFESKSISLQFHRNDSVLTLLLKFIEMIPTNSSQSAVRPFLLKWVTF